MNIHITPSEMYMAAQAGFLRTIQNIYKGAQSAYGADQDGIDWKISIEGGIAEFVVAKALNLHWSGKGVMRGPDVGNYQVRSTRYKTGRLLVNPKDDDDSVFILVIGIPPDFKVRGWMFGYEAKQEKYWNTEDTREGAFLVPQSDLRSMEELK